MRCGICWRQAGASEALCTGKVRTSMGRAVRLKTHLRLRLAGRGGVEGQRHDKGEARPGVAHNVELVLGRLQMRHQQRCSDT